MEALNAAGLTPLSVFSERRVEPKSLIPQHSLKFTKSGCLSRTINGGLVLMSSISSSGLAKSLTYEEALGQSVRDTGSDFDPNGVLESITNFGAENPAIIGAGVAILAVPFLLSQVFKKSKPWGIESARNSYAKLGDDATTQLLDIRAPAEFKQVGSPDLRGSGKKLVSIAYKGEDKPGFLKKLMLKFKEPENTTLFILDKFDGNSELVAELVTLNGFKAAYAIKDGADGPRGWINSGLPWLQPRKAFSLDLSNLTESLGSTFEGAGDVGVVLGVVAATGLGLLTFTEVETILQVLGLVALVQFGSKKLIFAEDRKVTLRQLDEFVTKKVAPEELVDDIKEIGKALLPTPIISKALPPPEEATPEPPNTNGAAQAVEAAPEPVTEVSTPEINSVAKTEVTPESLNGLPRPLSPYPQYEDFKPPTSPSPSKP